MIAKIAGLTLKEQTSYYPFGMQIASLSYSGEDYTFGMQGQLKDDEMKGKGNSISFKYRDYDPRKGRMKSLEPLRATFPWNSPYAFSEYRVVDGIELEGLEYYYVADGRFVGNVGSSAVVQLINNKIIFEKAQESLNLAKSQDKESKYANKHLL